MFTFSAIFILLVCSLVAVLVKNDYRKAAVACLGTSLSSVIGLASLFFRTANSESITIPTNIPFVSFSFGIDNLSAFFLIVIFGISAIVGFYGLGYIKEHKKLAGSSPFFPLLTAAMAAVVISKDGLSFLICWEIMSLVSFFLVTAEHENKEVQNAGWIYLIATHLATAFLMLFFVIMAQKSGSLLFSDFIANKTYTPFIAGLLFIFALIGFGTKAGIFPFHVWLPHAHPAAPSYISAIMSGVMIKTGIYGILRAITFLDVPPLWWGSLLVGVGAISAVAGVLYALMQHDLKRLLAYHSVENIGIIVAGIGVGLIGLSKGITIIVVLGFGGAIFHVLNHAIFKSLLFLSAGSVANATHSLSIDRLGGLFKRLPFTGGVFLVASLSICGLPPFNGFISEWLVYIGLFKGVQSFSGYPVLLSTAGILGIAFAGGLAVACFTKVFGVVFLGEPRNTLQGEPKESGKLLTIPMVLLAVTCLLIGLFPNIIWPIILSAVNAVSNINTPQNVEAIASLNYISFIFAVVIIVIIMLMLLKRWAFRKKVVGHEVTWDCGYEHPSVKMQYTASSFAEPIGVFFKPILNPATHVEKLVGIFPKTFGFGEHVYDSAENGLFKPLFRLIESFLMSIRRRKKSTIQNYLALIFITLIILFVLEVWFGI